MQFKLPFCLYSPEKLLSISNVDLYLMFLHHILDKIPLSDGKMEVAVNRNIDEGQQSINTKRDNDPVEDLEIDTVLTKFGPVSCFNIALWTFGFSILLLVEYNIVITFFIDPAWTCVANNTTISFYAIYKNATISNDNSALFNQRYQLNRNINGRI